MKYTPEERLAIGKRIYEGEINVYQAAVEYGIGETCARNYMRRYRSANGLPAKGNGAPIVREKGEGAPKPVIMDPGLEEYESMTKEELIRELVRARIREERQKKGYEVKGVGAEKVFIPLNSNFTYKTNETQVGTWINGKPIYRRIVSGTLPNSEGYYTIANIGNIDLLISSHFILETSSFCCDGAVYAGDDTSDLDVGFVQKDGNVAYKNYVPGYFGSTIANSGKTVRPFRTNGAPSSLETVQG